MSAGAFTGALIGGRYRIVEKLGGGGMGDVYTVEHVEMGRRFALKLLNERCSEHPEAVERFRREAQAATRIEHENIVGVIDFGREGTTGPYYLVMELLRGEPLNVTLRQAGALPWPIVRKVALQLCDALQAVHDVGIVHRDLKPANCFRTRVGEEQFFVKILDFGIAKLRVGPDGHGESLTGTGALLGTPLYMAPEQADDSAHVDHRADVYSLGVIVYQMATGQLPIRGQSDVQLLYNVLHRAPTPLHEAAPGVAFPAGLEEVLLRALAKRPEQRFSDMREFATALRGVGEVQPATGSSAAPPGGVLAAAPAVSSDGAAGGPGQPSRVELPVATPPTELARSRRSNRTVMALLVAGSGVAVATLAAVLVASQDEAPSEGPARVEEAPSEVSARVADVEAPVPASAQPVIESPQATPSAPPPADTTQESVAPPAPAIPPVQEKVEPASETKAPSPAKPRTTGTSKPRVDKVPAAGSPGKPDEPPQESTAEKRAKQARARAIGMIEEIIRRHAARATGDRLKVSVVFAAVTGKAKSVDLGANITNTTFGKLVRADIQKLQIPVYNEAEIVIDQSFAIPQE